MLIILRQNLICIQLYSIHHTGLPHSMSNHTLRDRQFVIPASLSLSALVLANERPMTETGDDLPVPICRCRACVNCQLQTALLQDLSEVFSQSINQSINQSIRDCLC